MSKESAKLKKFEKVALDIIKSKLVPELYVVSKVVFKSVSFDGVFQDASGSTVVIEVALGGGGKELKSGPKRKMLADAFKLTSANHFLKNPAHVISRRILVVRNEDVKKNIERGWNGVALKSQGVEVMSAGFSSSEEAEIKSILKMCIEEQINDKQDP